MFFNSLDRVLQQVIQQPEWQKYREYTQIIQCWQQVVNSSTFKNTKPLYIDRETLYVATSSAVWAQELTLQRYSLIKKINYRLNFSLKDIRFSPAKWHNQQAKENRAVSLKEVNLQQPKTEKLDSEIVENQIDANTAIKNWLQNMQKKSQNLVECPQCKSLTTSAELSRWQVCRHCIAQKWHSEYRPPNN